MHLTYAELEDFLAELHRVAPEKRIALRGRLKHFQRLGWPEGTNQGKGARVQYGIGQTMSLVMAMEMLQLGLTPERVVEQMTYSMTYLPQGFQASLKAIREGDEDEILYVFSPECLYSLRGIDDERQGIQSVMIAKSKMPELANSPPFSRTFRYAVINLSELMSAYLSYFLKSKNVDEQLVADALDNWSDIAKRRMKARGVYYSEDYSDAESS